MDHYSIIKKNEIVSFTGEWIELRRERRRKDRW
jgi:hypothetical protein